MNAVLLLLVLSANPCRVCQVQQQVVAYPYPVLYQYRTAPPAQANTESEDARIARIVAEVLRQTGAIPAAVVLSPVARHCGRCHASGAPQEAKFSLDSLDTAEQRLRAIRALWHPPKPMQPVVSALKPEEMSELIDWLSADQQPEPVPAPPGR